VPPKRDKAVAMTSARSKMEGVVLRSIHRAHAVSSVEVLIRYGMSNPERMPQSKFTVCSERTVSDRRESV